MIVSPTMFFFLPLFLALVAVFAGWLYYSLRQRAPATPRRSRIYRCAGCGHVYADHRDRPLCRCHKCGAMNEALRR